MKILYAIQGTGNGHLTCARDLLPRLKEKAEVDILVSGSQVDLGLPYEINYQFKGLSFIFGKKGGIDYVETYKRSKLKKLFKEIKQLPVETYDLVITDFEPVSAWACFIKNIPCVGLSHQVAVINKNSPKPSFTDLLGQAVLKYYAPVKFKIGYHYLAYDKTIFTPLIRKEIRELVVTNENHYTVYLPAFSDKRIIKLLIKFPEIEWKVFSKHAKKSYQEENVTITPIHNENFIKSMAAAEGILCGAGFQTPAEVLYLKKKLMVIPMKGQYEQQCNAAALKMLGVPVIKNLKRKWHIDICKWIKSDEIVRLDFPDIADEVVQLLLTRFAHKQQDLGNRSIENYRSFRQLVLQKIFYQTSLNK